MHGTSMLMMTDSALCRAANSSGAIGLRTVANRREVTAIARKFNDTSARRRTHTLHSERY